ncbi:hypothetical protein ATS71_17885 [Pseudoalteromonas sp. H71]|nr:hypothetical protein ATS71_17885 [Pseudoalteromonas sp. H71]
MGFQRAVGGSRPLVAIANAIKPRIEVVKSLKSSHQSIIYKRCIITLTHSKLRFARQQAARLQVKT